VRVPSSSYHRQQAMILAGMALATNDPKKAEHFTLAAMQHLELAQAREEYEMTAPAAVHDAVSLVQK
jgi:hypothetical protein